MNKQILVAECLPVFCSLPARVRGREHDPAYAEETEMLGIWALWRQGCSLAPGFGLTQPTPAWQVAITSLSSVWNLFSPRGSVTSIFYDLELG